MDVLKKNLKLFVLLRGSSVIILINRSILTFSQPIKLARPNTIIYRQIHSLSKIDTHLLKNHEQLKNLNPIS
jgi:hypothetical protein